jgi:type I restriction enzyme S subunit
MRSIASICTRVSSGGTPSRRHAEYYAEEEGGIPWVKSKELVETGIRLTEERITLKGLQNSSAKLHPKNAVLMAMYGANVGQMGWLEIDATVNQAICAMIVDETKAHWRYVFYALRHFRADLIAKAHGAAQQNISQALIKKFEIPVPPLPTQSRIADILSAYDELIANNQRRIAVLEEMARALYREWFVYYRAPGVVMGEDGMPEGCGK